MAIIQARTGSTRLPAKVLMDIAGYPLIWHVLKRVKQARLVDDVVLAIPMKDSTTGLSEIAHSLDVPVMLVRGDENDLIYRYNATATALGVETIVRVPGDNPCVDPDEIDRIIRHYRTFIAPIGQWLTTNLDRNVQGNGYPAGLGAEVYDSWFMHWMDLNVEDKELREHPHKWAFKHGRVRTIRCPEELQAPELDFSVNTQADLDYIRDIHEHMPTNFRTKDILDYLGVANGTSTRSERPEQYGTANGRGDARYRHYDDAEKAGRSSG